MIPKGVMTELRRSRARFESEESYFDATSHYRFEYHRIARTCAREKNSIQTNVYLTYAGLNSIHRQ